MGDFIKAVDTTHSTMSGNDMFYVRNQYKNGININEIIFDKEDKVIGFYVNRASN